MTNATQAHELKVGDKVRSYDSWHWRDIPADERSCIIGTIEAILSGDENPTEQGCGCYKISVEAWRQGYGEELAAEHLPDYVYPPVNGTKTLFGDITDGVQKI